MKIYGFHPVREVLEKRPGAIEFVGLLAGRGDARIQEIETKARGAGIPIRRMSREELERQAGRAHNGVMASVAERVFDTIEQCLAGEKGTRTVLLLDEVTDPGNFGAILRSAAAFRAAVVIPERNSVPLSETVVKSSAGALERVKLGRVVNVARFLDMAKENGFWVYGAEAGQGSLFETDLSGDVVICMGSEGGGLRRLTRETCDGLVSIPISEGAGSLNVSTAAAVMLYEVVRQRSSRSDHHLTDK